MKNLLNAGIISSVFVILALLKSKYIDKEDKKPKVIINDALLVFVSVIAGEFAIEKMNKGGSIGDSAPTAFLGKAEF